MRGSYKTESELGVRVAKPASGKKVNAKAWLLVAAAMILPVVFALSLPRSKSSRAVAEDPQWEPSFECPPKRSLGVSKEIRCPPTLTCVGYWLRSGYRKGYRSQISKATVRPAPWSAALLTTALQARYTAVDLTVPPVLRFCAKNPAASSFPLLPRAVNRQLQSNLRLGHPLRTAVRFRRRWMPS